MGATEDQGKPMACPGWGPTPWSTPRPSWEGSACRIEGQHGGGNQKLPTKPPPNGLPLLGKNRGLAACGQVRQNTLRPDSCFCQLRSRAVAVFPWRGTLHAKGRIRPTSAFAATIQDTMRVSSRLASSLTAASQLFAAASISQRFLLLRSSHSIAKAYMAGM
jgi:hypothetical protein